MVLLAGGKLPIFQSDSSELGMVQTRWAAIIEPVLNNPLIDGNILKSVPLLTGSNVINHLLGRKLQGWCLIRQRAPGSVYDNQDNNSMPQLTLSLTASANMVVDLYVF